MLYEIQESDRRSRGYFRIRCFDALGKISMQEPNPERAVLIITNSPLTFDYLRSVSGKISYRGNLSAVLLDMEYLKIVDEVCLSTYKENEDAVFLLKK